MDHCAFMQLGLTPFFQSFLKNTSSVKVLKKNSVHADAYALFQSNMIPVRISFQDSMGRSQKIHQFIEVSRSAAIHVQALKFLAMFNARQLRQMGLSSNRKDSLGDLIF
jgi:hypothetical protein